MRAGGRQLQRVGQRLKITRGIDGGRQGCPGKLACPTGGLPQGGDHVAKLGRFFKIQFPCGGFHFDLQRGDQFLGSLAAIQQRRGPRHPLAVLLRERSERRDGT